MKILARLLVTTLAATLAAPFVQASETLCQHDEIDFFSCKTKAKGKIISICGNIKNFEINEDSWLQYRFGKPRAVEFVYPQETIGSISKFEGNNFMKYYVVDLRFINKKTRYSVSIEAPYSGEDAREHPRYSGGVTVEVAKTKPVRIACVNSTSFQKYYDHFAGLNEVLRSQNGETDIFFHFHNHVAK